MRPAFASTKSAAAFGLLVAAILLLPAVFGRNWLPPRAESYAAEPWVCGPYPFIHQQLFEEQGDLDVVFIGSSHMFFGIDTAYVQQQLSEKLGRKAGVITLGWPWAGFDAAYFIARDLLQNRRVRLLVVYNECGRADTPHPVSDRWFRWADDAGTLTGLPFYSQAGLYASAIIGMPRNLLSLVRTNRPADLAATTKNYFETTYNAPNPVTHLGALSCRQGFNYDPSYADHVPETIARPADACLLTPATRAMFQRVGPPVPPYQLHFARQLSLLAQAHGTKLLFLHLPEIAEARSAVIPERELWPEHLPAPASLLGIPPARLFAGLTDEEIKQLFCDSLHLNQNGQRYFTPLITPALIQFYEAQTNQP